MGESVGRVKQEINAFRKRFYLNLLLKGILLSLLLVLSYLILASTLEYALWLSSTWRAIILICFFGLIVYSYFKFLITPLKWFTTKKGLSEEESAHIIGARLPNVKDRLLNLIQLISLSDKESILAQASIAQRSVGLAHIPFSPVVDIRENIRYLRWLAIPLLIGLGLVAWNAAILTQGSSRIVQFNKAFVPQAPFNFNVLNEDMQVFRNEDFQLNLQLEGASIPERVVIVSGKRLLKMEQAGAGLFSYTFNKVQEPLRIYFEASGFRSNTFEVLLAERPELLGIKAELNFPPYLQRKPEFLTNAGNLVLPEGTTVRWNIAANHTALAKVLFEFPTEISPMEKSGDQNFIVAKTFKESKRYNIQLENDKAKNKEQIIYQVEVIKDQYPQISASVMTDTVAFRYLVLGGEVSDDYGLTELRLNYELQRQGSAAAEKVKNIPIQLNTNQLQQGYSLFWPIDSLKLGAGDRLNYFLEVWDNDGVNGRKSSKTALFQLSMPGKEAIKAEIAKNAAQTEQSINKSVEMADEVKKRMEESRRDIRGKQSLNWEDKKMIEDLLQQQEDLSKMLREMQEKNKALEDRKEALTELDEKLREKAAQLQQLMDELLDDETRRLLEELQKLLEENADPTKLQKQLDEMLRNQNVLQKNLERAKELYKRLQFEYQVNEAAKELQEQIERQEALAEKTAADDKSKEEKNKQTEQSEESKGKENQQEGGDQSDKQDRNDEESSDNQSLAKEQEQIKEDYQSWEKQIEELEEQGREMRMKNNLPSEEQMQEVEEMMQQSQEELQQNNSEKAKQKQKQGIQKMQQMQEQMQQQQSGMQMEMDMENLESMRHILHDLVKLSFDQEDLFTEFVEVRQSDPRFVSLSQQQLKLQDDFKVISDSLQALSERMFMLQAFLPREIEAVNANLDKSMEELRERRKANAVQAMRFTMTSMNNLALLFDDMMQAMMEAMANAMPSNQKMKDSGKPQNISELQRKLNEEINELKEGGKQGREQSEELARMAAEQERIRRAFQEMQEKLKQDGVEIPGSDIPGKMEQTELDLVNKQITEMTIRRQQEILTRMLESEKAMRERELEEERKGETAKPYENELPKAFEEYLRLKEKELELLKTVPPKLYPYYKREVGEYFKRMGND